MSFKLQLSIATTLVVLGLVMVLAGCAPTTAPQGTSPTSAPESQAPRVGLAPLPAGERASVVRVTDGDTITVMLAGRRETVRILGIDTPETKKPRTPVKCGGPEASAYAQRALAGTVTLSLDSKTPQGRDRDRYGRLLRYVATAAGNDYSLDVLSRGLGRFVEYGKKIDRREDYQRAWASSQAAKRGVYGKPCSGNSF